MNCKKTKAELEQMAREGKVKLTDPTHEIYTSADYTTKYQPSDHKEPEKKKEV